MNTKFKHLDDALAALRAAQPLKPEDESRLWKKFRLEWNYNSNHIEGNTLTYGETELLLITGHTTGSHTIREYEEMKAHDVAVLHVRELAKTAAVVGETDIRDFNKIVLKEPFWKEAVTRNGHATRIQVIPGEYKQLPNNVQTATGEFVTFTPPTDTPAKMQNLVKWLGASLEGSQIHPIELASKLHHDFVLIHPFDDGNGRVARLLVNYVLMRTGFPPIIIKSADKAKYISALRQADAGNLDALTEYLDRQLTWSLDISLRASRGESVEEPSDVEKQIALLISDLRANRKEVKQLSKDVLLELFKLSWEPLFDKYEEKMTKLIPLFATARFYDSAMSQDWKVTFQSSIENSSVRHLQGLGLHCQFEGYHGSTADHTVNLSSSLAIAFEQFRYRILAEQKVVATKLYSEMVLSDEAEAIAATILRDAFARLQLSLKQ